jgi:prepilin-type N-terminal cleavage/methylation domain-containing protein
MFLIATQPRSAPRKRTGHTLIELVVVVTVSGILIAGLTSTLYTASRGVSGESSTRAVLDGSAATSELLGDLQQAVTFTQRSATAVEFTVADRGGDAAPETIRYAWSGTPGDPFTRQYNGGSVVNLTENIQEFQLSYDLRAVAKQTPSPVQEQPNVTAVYLEPELSPELSYVVSTNTWCGQSFLPDPASLPADAIQWKLTYIIVRIKPEAAAKEVTTVELRLRDTNGLPTGPVLDQFQVEEKNLDSKNWTPIPFPQPINAPWLPPTQGLCLLLKPFSGHDNCAVLYQATSSPAAANVAFLQTSNGGTTWTADGNLAMTQCYGYATVRVPGPVQSSTTYYLTHTGMTLRAGPDASARIDSGINVLNEPEVTGP